MCIIAIKPKYKKMFTDAQIEIMFANNPDGAGYMYFDGASKKVVVHKGFMTCKDLLKSLHAHDLTKTNVVLHFRIGTSGLFNELNCHPFTIYGDNSKTSYKTDLAMAHNGILYDYTPAKTSTINDTQVFINSVLKNLKKGFIYDADKMNLIHELIGTNKLAFLDKNNNLKLVGEFIKDNGYIYSNTSYKPRLNKCMAGASTCKTQKVKSKLDAHANAPTGMTYQEFKNAYTHGNAYDDDEYSSEFWRWYDEKYLY